MGALGVHVRAQAACGAVESLLCGRAPAHGSHFGLAVVSGWRVRRGGGEEGGGAGEMFSACCPCVNLCGRACIFVSPSRAGWLGERGRMPLVW